MKKRHIVFLTVIIITIIVIIILSNSKTSEAIQIDTEVQQGKFDIIVTVTGELQARNSVKIEAPYQILREVRMWEISRVTKWSTAITPAAEKTFPKVMRIQVRSQAMNLLSSESLSIS